MRKITVKHELASEAQLIRRVRRWFNKNPNRKVILIDFRERITPLYRNIYRQSLGTPYYVEQIKHILGRLNHTKK